MVVGVVAFVVALLVSVMLHEAGHFATARVFGMKATKFFLGFGPTLWSFRRGETEYGIKAIWAGGFVKIIGMTPLEEVDRGDEPRAFFRKPAWQRVIVLSAGSFMHLVIAFVLFVGVLVAAGRTSATVQPVVDKVSPCRAAVTGTSTSCPPGAQPAPAAVAGLRPGDRIVAINGQRVATGIALTERIHASPPGKPLSLTVERDGRALTLTATPVSAVSNGAQVSLLGFAPRLQVRHEHYSVAAAIPASGRLVGQTIGDSFTGLGTIVQRIPALFDFNHKRDATGAVGLIGTARVSGEAVQSGQIAVFFLLIASLNIFFGVFNMLPLLPLDGGHVAIAVFEGVRRRVAAWRHAADPGPVDLLKVMPVAYVVIFLFVGLTLLLVAQDIVNPIANPF